MFLGGAEWITVGLNRGRGVTLPSVPTLPSACIMLKPEEQHVCTTVSSLFPPPALPGNQNKKAGDDDDKDCLRTAGAHSPSGSPHSVHCDSKRGPERNRRLITQRRRILHGGKHRKEREKAVSSPPSQCLRALSFTGGATWIRFTAGATTPRPGSAACSRLNQWRRRRHTRKTVSRR